MRRKLRTIVLMHEETVPPDTIDGFEYQEMLEWKGEYD
ncbi:MAG: D-alanine--D-alanine ligase, partial [Deltaproteobacteria bacterium]|nr:D-alanine--D-alanine ligase [Deltaproteobacteria bacterium]MBW2536310.1 D-alanine--D-alanine ligase [Deltaproteobacteria bacterium]